MFDDVMTIGQAALELAREFGADAADVVAVGGEGTDIDIRDGNIEKLERDEGSVVGLRVFVGKSSALTSGNVMTREAMRKLAENAVAMARLAPPDAFAGIAPAELLSQRQPSLDLAAATLPDTGALQRMATEAEQAALAVTGVTRSGGASASASRRRVALLTSNGFPHPMSAPAFQSASPPSLARRREWSGTMTIPQPSIPQICAQRNR